MKRLKGIYEEIKKCKAKYINDIEYTKQNVAPVVLDDELSKLKVAYMQDLNRLKDKIGTTIVGIKEEKNKPLDDYKNSAEYKDKLNYSLNMIKNFGDKLDKNTLNELLQPLVKAGDMQTLNILEQAMHNSLPVSEAKIEIDNITNMSKIENMTSWLYDFAGNDAEINLTLEGQFMNMEGE